MDIGDKQITISYRTTVVCIISIAGFISWLVFQYIGLVSKADAAAVKAQTASEKLEETSKTLDIMQCDLRQLKNFMVYNIRPLPTDRCDGK